MKVAITTDALVSFGGADRVLKSLLKIYPSAHIFTSVYNEEMYPWLKEKTVKTSFIQKFPFQKLLYRHFWVFSPMAFEQFDMGEYDLVISLSAGCAKGVITGVDTRHIGIILTPPRYQWGGEINARASRLRSLFRLLAPFVDNYLRVWDFEASKRPDELISISKFIQKRVKKHYRRDSEVIYLGTEMENWYPDDGSIPDNDFYFIASRLYDYKRIDLAIKACNRLSKNLVIMGSGPDERYLKRIAGRTIKFYPSVSDDSVIRRYMSQAKAFLFPGIEDFGLTPIESMVCGTPVIALNKGGVSETVLESKTGHFFEEQTVESLVKAIEEFENMKFMKKDVIERGKYFSEERFISEIKEYIKK
jgi:glycosyltransferase involved in cell wall biosynthesis